MSQTQPSTARVLVADDDPAILDAVEMILDMEGYAVSLVSGGDIVAAAAREQPDLILLDLRLSGQDGRDVHRALKAEPATASIAVVFVSANREGAAIAREAGADAFLAKPFELDDLLELVAQFTDRTPAN